MCSYLGAEKVAVDAAKPRRTGKTLVATGAITTVVSALLAGCSGVSVNVGSNSNGSQINTNQETPVVQEVTWIDVEANDLIANPQQYVGKEVYVRNTVVVSKDFLITAE